MAFAKLSGALLASNDAQPARTPAREVSAAASAAGERATLPADEGIVGETVPSAVNVAPLYDKLRDCIRASDQEGVARIFAELVRAQRPVSEISEVVASLAKLVEKTEPEANGPSIEDFSQPSATAEFQEGATEPTDPDPHRTVDPRFMLENDEDDAVGPPSEIEHGDASADDWPQCDAIPESEQSTPNPPPQTRDWATAALDEVTESPRNAATVADAMQPIGATGYRRPVLSRRACVRAAMIAAVAIAGSGAFLLMQPTVTEVGAGIAHPADRSSAITADPSVSGAANTGQSSTVAAPAGPAAARPSEVAVNNTSPSVIAPAVPESRPADRADAKPASVAPDSHRKAHTGAASAAEGPPAATPPAAITPAIPERPPTDRPKRQPIVASLDAPDTQTPTAIVSPAADRPVAAVPRPAIAPAVPPDSSADQSDPKPVVASLEAPKNAAPTVPSESAATPAPFSLAPEAASPEPTRPKEPPSPSIEAAPLLERGDRLFGVGDIASARLFYERAADAGDGQAALRLGETYDPAFLERAQLRVQGDRPLAVQWYRRARELGASEAEILLKGAQAK